MYLMVKASTEHHAYVFAESVYSIIEIDSP